MKPRGVLNPFPFYCVMEKVISMKLENIYFFIEEIVREKW